MVNTILILFSLTFFQMCHAQYDLENKMSQYVNVLSHDSLEGRATGSLSEKKANEYIRLEWFDTKKVSYYNWNYNFMKDSVPIKSQMAGCLIKNGSKKTILIGAHVDHLGIDTTQIVDSMRIYNGADNNASGIAILLALQNELSKIRLNVNVLLVAYTGYENGLLGSEYIASHLPKKANNLVYVIDLNKLGGLNEIDPELFVSTSESSIEMMKKIQAPFVLTQTDSSNLSKTDCKNFINKNIICSSFTTGTKDIHQTYADDAVHINVKGMVVIEQFLMQWITKKYALIN